MTGGEIIPIAASAVGKAAEGVLGEDETVKQQLARMAEDSAPMKHAAHSYATRVAIKQAILTKMYWPLAKMFGLRADYFENEFGADMAERLGDIPEADLAEPKPNVVVPAMEALGYSLNEPDLKEMYLNLLATATKTSTAPHAHPSFVEVIRQLSGEEAPLLKDVLAVEGGLPICRIQVNVPTGGYRVIAKHVLDLRDKVTQQPAKDDSSAVWIDNWMRLGLVDVDYSQQLVTPGSYSWVEHRPEHKSAEVLCEEWNKEGRGNSEPDQWTVGWQEGLLSITDFGRRFAYAIGASTTP